MALATETRKPAQKLSEIRGRVSGGAALVPFFVLISVFFFVPTYYVLKYAGGPGLPGSSILQRPGVDDVFVRTLEISVVVTLLCAIFGYVYAQAIVRARGALKAVLLAAVVVPFLTSLLVRSYAWTVVLGDNGPVTRFLRLFLPDNLVPHLIYNQFAVVIGTAHVLLPMFVLPLYAVLSQVNPEVERAARSLGASRTSTFLKITLPLSLPGVAAGGVLVFIQALGFYITPALLGGSGQQMASGLIAQQLRGQTLDLKAAALLSLLLLAVVAFLLLTFRAAYPLESLFITPLDDIEKKKKQFRIGTRDGRAMLVLYGLIDRLPWTAINRTMATVIFVYLLSPLLVVIPVSFTSAGYVSFPPSGFSLRWYRQIISSPEWRGAAQNSLVAGGLGTVIALLVGIPLSFTLVRSKISKRIKSATMFILMLPALMPIVVLSVGVFVFFLKNHLLGSRLALAVTYAVLCLPYVTIVQVAALRDFDRRVEDAARSLGAGRLRTITAITLPILARSILAGAMFGFLICLDELLIAQAVTDPGQETLAIRIWQGANEQLSPALAAYSCVSLFLTVLLAVIVRGLRRRTKGASV
jgi:putative spermidine/putrescine transport system permease protein